ncbi:Hypothetical_protein [Hexamita inflata]|uniref:Hypothetical_protein n=1 Tax=Hexamita inflata TaxID=28002 RepID=A0AA86UGR6_9EUKA|nr:Hypothetical protein HINF_LOCUS45087 [Hexamita inflata]CAI9957445.1 Hypothetical protein HINF_LOCUS45090 [Hexamita inflata]
MFYFAQDQHYLLVMNWTENIDSTSFNSYHCYQFYPEIHIHGVQNGSLFNDYSILSKTKTLRFTRCFLDLSKIQGDFDSMTLEQCECVNDFANCKNDQKCDSHSLQFQWNKLRVYKCEHIYTQLAQTLITNNYIYQLQQRQILHWNKVIKRQIYLFQT